ncbi:lytic transglycosylase domain-containing protein [Allosphingosinicella vermicomposti]|uniref:lytic transglycosylase domain-containing protein n=1 Tax=Allosphingosinicella vermicomposti TaxID=614671 RepID=UPI001FDF28D9|nr:lytic transglycosylase domain-containing protein [Allosphingosinicella vermicomposti]
MTIALLAASVAAVASTGPVAVRTLLPGAVQVAQNVPAPQVQPQAAAPQAQNFAVSPATSQAIAQWNSLRQSSNQPFSAYASFLMTYRGFPGETGLRRDAERAIDPATTAPGDVVAFFRVHPPLTPGGHAKYALALQAQGMVAEAQAAARTAWASGVMATTEESRLLSAFGRILSPADHDRRMETLLDNGDTASALRALPYASGTRRAIYDARIALQTRTADAAAKLNMAQASGTGDAGLLRDRANWMRSTGQSLAARNLLAQPRTLVTKPANAEKWFETLLIMARGAAADSQWLTAYQIASQVDDAYPAGTDVSNQPYGERDEYTSLTWLAGTTALHRLNRPVDAIGMFERYGRAARSPQTRAKGFYWAARAATQAGQAERSAQLLNEAAAYPDQFYGQLAMERLGRPIPAPSPTDRVTPTPEARAAFARRPIVQATRLLGMMGRREDQALFIRALSDQLTTPEEHALADEFARQIARPDLGVWVARQARSQGTTVYTLANFPTVQVPPAYDHHWTLANAITRQESSFDRTAQSHVGARGMMQLMPGTAREVAGQMGMPYELGRLTVDPQYNVMLGSKYFADLMTRYGNFAPMAVAAYNAGPGNVNKWIRANGDPRLPGADVLRWIEDIPFQETRNYVQRVLENAVVYDTINPRRSAVGPVGNRMSYYLGQRIAS